MIKGRFESFGLTSRAAPSSPRSSPPGPEEPGFQKPDIHSPSAPWDIGTANRGVRVCAWASLPPGYRTAVYRALAHWLMPEFCSPQMTVPRGFRAEGGGEGGHFLVRCPWIVNTASSSTDQGGSTRDGTNNKTRYHTPPCGQVFEARLISSKKVPVPEESGAGEI